MYFVYVGFTLCDICPACVLLSEPKTVAKKLWAFLPTSDSIVWEFSPLLDDALLILTLNYKICSKLCPCAYRQSSHLIIRFRNTRHFFWNDQNDCSNILFTSSVVWFVDLNFIFKHTVQIKTTQIQFEWPWMPPNNDLLTRHFC